jgi:hypothetical protein
MQVEEGDVYERLVCLVCMYVCCNAFFNLYVCWNAMSVCGIAMSVCGTAMSVCGTAISVYGNAMFVCGNTVCLWECCLSVGTLCLSVGMLSVCGNTCQSRRLTIFFISRLLCLSSFPIRRNLKNINLVWTKTNQSNLQQLTRLTSLIELYGFSFL